MARNPKLVYGRLTGWGQDGPLAHVAGHSLNYESLTGAIGSIGPVGGPPVPLLQVLGDFAGGGLHLAYGVVCALLEASRTGKGQVVDAAMIDGVMSLYSVFYGMSASGMHTEEIGSNLFDGGAPFYNVYETSDGKYVTAAPIEPHFYRQLLDALGIPADELPEQYDRSRWPEVRERLAAVFRTRTRDEWQQRLEGTDVCFAPVMRLAEAHEHPHNIARGAFVKTPDGGRQVRPSPRLSGMAGNGDAVNRSYAYVGADTDVVLGEFGLERGRDRGPALGRRGRVTDAPLGGIRVVDLSTGISGAYATKLFVDAGADVVKVEPPGGDPLRQWSASGATGDAAGALFRFLAAGKHSVVGRPGDADIERLIATADLLVDSGDAGLDPQARCAADPRLVLCSITPFGLTGPYAGRPATEFTVQAECGSIAGRGMLDRPPVQAGGRIAEWSAGATAAAAALAVLRRSTRTGEGALLDVSWFEVMILATNLFSDLMFSLMGRPQVPVPPRSVELPSIDKTADGWVGFNTNGFQHWRAFAELVERPDLVGHEQFGNIAGRIAARAEWDAIVRAYTGVRPTSEVLKRAEELRVPAARVNDGRSVLTEEQVIARDFYATDPATGVRSPRPHYLRNGQRPATGGPAPELGADDPATLSRERPQTTQPPTGELPLAGVKVLDLTAWWAGPAVSQVLAAMGAEAIHVESLAHLDPMRLASAVMFMGRDRWWEFSGFHMQINTNKKGVTIDLAGGEGDGDEGRALLRRLVEWADVVVENYTPARAREVGDGLGDGPRASTRRP